MDPGNTTSALWKLQKACCVGQYLITCWVLLCYSGELLTVPNKFLSLVTLEDTKQSCPALQLLDSNSTHNTQQVSSGFGVCAYSKLCLHSTQHNPVHWMSSSHSSHFYLLIYFFPYLFWDSGDSMLVCSWLFLKVSLRVLLLKGSPFVLHLFSVRNHFTLLAKVSENHFILPRFSNLKTTKLICNKILAWLQWSVMGTIWTVLVM